MRHRRKEQNVANNDRKRRQRQGQNRPGRAMRTRTEELSQWRVTTDNYWTTKTMAKADNDLTTPKKTGLGIGKRRLRRDITNNCGNNTGKDGTTETKRRENSNCDGTKWTTTKQWRDYTGTRTGQRRKWRNIGFKSLTETNELKNA